MKRTKALDDRQMRLINGLSYTFIDSLGKEKIQSIYDFEEENRAHFERVQPRSRPELAATAEFMARNKAAFYFFQPPKRVIWGEYQRLDPIRNQALRNTCSAFAMTAAIEARYARDFGLSLDLSQQFFWHSYKSTSLSFPREYKYENQSSFWGGGSSHGIRKAVNFAIPLDADCRYLSRDEMESLRDQIPAAGQLQWKREPSENSVTQDEVDAFEYSPLYIPDTAREKARYGAKSYVTLDKSQVRDTGTLEQYISWGNEVIIDANLKWRVNPATEIREYDVDAPGAFHVFLLVGYDRDEQAFYVKNSWGEDDFIRVSYEFARNCFYSGSIVTAVTDPDSPTVKGRSLGRWQMNHDGWKGELIIRRYAGEDNSITRLGHYRTANGTIKAVNGHAIHDGRGVKFYIIDGDDVAPTITSGQSFTLDVFSWDVTRGAGDTFWNGTPFGSYISRDPFQSTPGANFQPNKWLGSWSMSHDGWEGELTISHVVPVQFATKYFVLGEYRPQNGNPRTVTGSLDGQHPHVFHFTIPFTSENHQPFVLHFHTWSADLASGYTFWNGERFGAVAFKR